MPKRRILALALALLFFTVPSAAADKGQHYDVAAAVAYAEAHWANGIGQCAEFVSNCLAAGGIIVPYSYDYYQPDDLRIWGAPLGEFTNPYICAAALLKWLSTDYTVIVKPLPSEMSLGDLIFMDDVNPDGHVGIITGFDGDMPLFTAHNDACHNAPVGDAANFLVKLSDGGKKETLSDRFELLLFFLSTVVQQQYNLLRSGAAYS